MRKYKNEELVKLVNMAKENGFKVYGFQENEPISQVFIVDTASGGICTASASWGLLNYATVHKPCKGFGTGFRLNEEEEKADINKIKSAMAIVKPYWAKGISIVKKYSNFEEYVKLNSILKYFEL